MNPKVLEQNVDQIADLKKEIYEKNPKLKAIRQLFKDNFGRNPSELIHIANALFWKDGFPDQDSTSKLHRFLDRFAVLVHWFRFLENSEIENYLKSKGVDVSNSIQLIDLPLDKTQISDHDWWEAFGSTEKADRGVELMNMLLDVLQEEMKDNFDKESKIDEIAEKTEAEEKVKKNHVQKAAHLRFKQLIKKSIDKDLSKIEENIQSQNSALTIFEKK